MTRIIILLNNRVFLALLSTTGIAVNLVIIGQRSELKPAEWAAWVQAVGSIVAILGSVWAAVHSTNSASRARKEDAREASVAQLVFSRALLVQAVNSAAMIKACAESALLEDMKHEVSATAEILSTLKMLISSSRDTELTGLLVSAYETIGITHSQAKTVSLTATGLASTEFAAGSTVRELDRLRVDLRSVATRLGAPAEPAGPEADFDVLSDEEVQEQA